MKLFKFYTKYFLRIQCVRHVYQEKPRHLICFKQWTAEMVMEILCSAINLKCSVVDTHNKRMSILNDSKVMILQEVNEPILNMAVSKAATFLGAYDVNIVDHLIWENNYAGKVFSLMADVIFVATATHMCVQRFANQSTVPVLCMRSRTHASIQSLATVMAIIEEYGTMNNVTVAYLGHAHPVLNSYLLLCPMLGAHIRFLCCCRKETGVSPLLYKASTELCNRTHTEIKECTEKQQLLNNATVIISGPTKHDEKAMQQFSLTENEINMYTTARWSYFHTCPRGEEVDDSLFNHYKSRTTQSFQNMQYIAAALMANAVKGFKF